MTSFGPISVGPGWRTVGLTFDVVNIGGILDCVVEWSQDSGASWQPLASVLGITGPGTDRTGAVSTNGVLQLRFSETVPAAQLRATLTNSLPFVTLGGSFQAA